MTVPALPVLFIGGLDSSGGAGVLRDCATAAACGVSARVAVTAVTAQTDHAVAAVETMRPGLVADQMAAAGPVGAVKIGMLGTAGLVRAVAAGLPRAPCILDPVLCASSGRALLTAGGIGMLLAVLLPRVTLLTPNLPELVLLARRLGLADRAEPAQVAALLARGCGAVLVKGGHARDSSLAEDRLYRPDHPPLAFRAPRIAASARGTGCELASAIAAHLALGRDLPAAIASAKAAVHRRIAAAADAPAPDAVRLVH